MTRAPLTESPLDMVDVQQRLLGEVLELQTDWVGQLCNLQAAWLALFFPWLKDPTGYLPSWMIHHEGLEQLA